MAPGPAGGWGGRATEVPPYYADPRQVKLSDALVEVDIKRAVGREYPVCLSQPRFEKGEVIVEGVEVGRCS